MSWRMVAMTRAPTTANATTQSVRQEYVSWGNNGIEDYIDMTGAFPQGPWLPIYLVWAPAALPLITRVKRLRDSMWAAHSH